MTRFEKHYFGFIQINLHFFPHGMLICLDEFLLKNLFGTKNHIILYQGLHPILPEYDYAWLMQDGMFQISQNCNRLDKPRRLTRRIGNCIVSTKRENKAWYYNHPQVLRENLHLYEYCLMWLCQFSRFLGSKFRRTKSQCGQVRNQALYFTGEMLNCVDY